MLALLAFVAALSAGQVAAGEIFTQDLRHRGPGAYTRAMLREDWNGAGRNNGVDEGRARLARDGRGPYLRVTYPADQFGPGKSGAQWKARLRPGAGWETLEASYRVRFEPGFDFGKGGKLPGLCGGACNSGGKKPNGRDGWSARNMWRRDGQVVQYLYYPDQKGSYGEDLPYLIGGKKAYLAPGQWHEIRVRLKLNAPGNKDGRLLAWFDGRLALEVGGLRFRDTAALKIDQFYFSTFHGGNDASWSPRVASYANFDSFSIRTVESSEAGR